MIRCNLTRVNIGKNYSNKKIVFNNKNRLKKDNSKIKDKDDLSQKLNIDSITKNIETLSFNSEENIKLDISMAQKNDNMEIDNYKTHYISFSLITLSGINEINDLDKKYFLISSILVQNTNNIYSYKINYHEGYKFKKNIRENVINNFKFKNKDILTIKSIKKNQNYHYYIVILKSDNKRINQYKNDYDLIEKDKFYWKNNINLYNPITYSTDFSVLYSNLVNQEFINYKLYSKSSFNFITIGDIYRVLALVSLN